MRNPPFLGGQGRTARDVRRDGHQAAFTLVLAFVVVLLVLARACTGDAMPKRTTPSPVTPR